MTDQHKSIIQTMQSLRCIPSALKPHLAAAIQDLSPDQLADYANRLAIPLQLFEPLADRFKPFLPTWQALQEQIPDLQEPVPAEAWLEPAYQPQIQMDKPACIFFLAA